MQTAFRKMGNSTGMIVPKALLEELGAGVGTKIDVRVEGGQLIAVPAKRPVREGWAEDAARLASEPLTDEERDWMAFGNEADDDWTW